MKDLTQLIFINIGWLLLGFAVYYLFASLKVFLLVRIQPLKYYNPDNIPFKAGPILKLYFKTLPRSWLLHQNTRQYLFGKSQKDTWKSVGDKKIDLYVNFVQVLLTLLKPYLIIAVIWAILKDINARKLWYNEMRITLAEIQLKLSAVNSNPVYNHFKDYKDWYFIGIMLCLAFLTLTKKWEDRVAAGKKLISTGFVICSVVFGLSFFGADLGKQQENRKKELAELQFEVKGIHEHIFKNITEAVIFRDLSEAVTEDVLNAAAESRRLDSIIQQARSNFPVGKVPETFDAKTGQLKNEYRQQTEVTPPKPTPPRNNFAFTQYFQQAKNENSTQPITEAGQYFENSKNWNKQEGEEYLKASESLKKDNKALNPEVNQKLHEVAEEITQNIFGKIAELGWKAIGIDDFKTGNAVLEFVGFEGIKYHLQPVIKKAAIQLQKGGNAILGLFSSVLGKKGNSSERIEAVRTAHNDQVMAISKEAFEIAAKEKARETTERSIRATVAGLESLSGYSEFIDEASKEYLSTQDIKEIPVSGYRNYLTSTGTIPKNMLNSILCLASVANTHPGERATCPICMYLETQGIILK